MYKVYKTREERLAALKKAIDLRKEWEEAVRLGANREEMEQRGLKPVNVTK